MKCFTPVLAFLLSTAAALAQTPTASVSGRVTDTTGAVLPGVTVVITNPETNISKETVSDAEGSFTVLYLNPASYVLEARLEGFSVYRREAFTLEVGQDQRLDIRMEVGGLTEAVTVTEALPVVNVRSGTRGDVTSASEVAELPLAGREFSDLAYLTGGVTPKGDGGDGSFAVNGARADNGGFLLDGVNNNQRRNTNILVNPPVEGIQEFKMLTSGYSAEYGRYAGGMMSVVTKSGTNRFAGSVYEFMRNDALDAQGYFDPEKMDLRRNQFGATVSGPVWLGKLYDGHDKTFFMFTWESLRQTAGESQRTLVPTPEMLRGDFSKATDAAGRPVVIRDTLTGQPFPNNQIPADRLNPVALNLAAYYPAPNLTGSSFNYVAQDNSTNRFDSFGVKVEHTLRSSDRLTGSTFWRYAGNWDPLDADISIPTFGTSNDTLELLSYVKYLSTLSSSTLLETSVNYSHRTNNEVWPESPTTDWQAETGFVGGTTDPIAAGPPEVLVTGYASLGTVSGIPKIWNFDNVQASAVVTSIKGRHALKFGGDFLRMWYNNDSYAYTRGRTSFLGRFTGHPVSDFMLGWVDSSRRALEPAGPHHRVNNFAAFFQDDFRVSEQLTLNLGLRYDLLPPPTEARGALGEFMPPLGKVVTAGLGGLTQAEYDARLASTGLTPYVVMASDVGLPESIVKTDYNNFAPRFGFAWTPFGNSRTVLRGGFGLFYGTASLYRMDDYSQVYPFAVTETFSRVSADPNRLTLSNPFPTDRRGFSGVTSSYGQSTDSPQSQYLQSWNLTLERDVYNGVVVELAYAGSKGVHLQRRYDINQAGRDPANSTVRPYPFFGAIQIISDSAPSSFHSGQVSVRRNYSKDFFIRGAYTFARSMDESSNTGGTIKYGFPTAQDSNNLHAEWGRSDFDVRHAFTGSAIWTPTRKGPWLVRDWQTAGTWSLYSGPPFTPRTANVSYSAGEATRPDRIASGEVENPSADQWYDVKAFAVVPTGAYRFGNSGRNILSGPGTVNINLSLSRRFRFDKTRALQFRLESFNLPNRVNLGLPENNVDVPTAGSIKTAKNPRTMQVGLRFEF